MICTPPCVNCTGLCKASKTNTQKVARGGTSRSGYILMTCLHYTTPEDQVVMRSFKPKGRKAWCEKCGSWKPIAPIGHSIPVTEEGLF